MKYDINQYQLILMTVILKRAVENAKFIIDLFKR